MTKLAIINAWKKEIDGWNYFKYYKIDFYKLKKYKENDKCKRRYAHILLYHMLR